MAEKDVCVVVEVFLPDEFNPDINLTVFEKYEDAKSFLDKEVEKALVSDSKYYDVVRYDSSNDYYKAANYAEYWHEGEEPEEENVHTMEILCKSVN